MNTGMKMLATSMASKRGSDGRYMEGNYSRMEDAPEMRRQRDSRGRYMEHEGTRMAYEGNQGNYGRMEQGGNASHYWPGPHIPPYLDRPDMMDGRRMESGGNRMHEMPDGQNPYGGQPEVYRRQEEKPEHIYKDNTVNITAWKHKTDPLDQHDGKQRMIGFGAGSDSHDKLDKQTAMEWVESMEDSVGVRGGKYTWHQAQQMGQQVGMHGEEQMIEFYAIVNAMYSDYSQAAKKFGVDKPDFYACLAKAFIEDKDAVEGKVYKYYECIAK